MTDKEKLIDLFKTEGCIVDDETEGCIVNGESGTSIGIYLPNVMGEFYRFVFNKDDTIIRCYFGGMPSKGEVLADGDIAFLRWDVKPLMILNVTETYLDDLRDSIRDAFKIEKELRKKIRFDKIEEL